MKANLAEYYGRRFTPMSRIALFILIILFGIFITYRGGSVGGKIEGGIEKNILNP